MNNAAVSRVPSGLLFPEPLLHSDIFTTLTIVVAVNAVMFAALALAKILPRIYLNDWTRRRDERSETRSIHPDAPARPRRRRHRAKARHPITDPTH